MYEPETIWEFSIADQVKFGAGAAEELPTAVQERNASSVLFVTDRGILDAGIIDYLTDVVESHDIAYDVHADVEPEPSIDVYEDALASVETFAPDVIIGVGGGSSMDVAKTMSTMLECDGNVLEYAASPVGKGRTVPESGLPCICIPTTSGTGSETSPVAVVSVPDQNLKGGLSSQYLLPDLALVDPALLTSLPPAPTAFSGMDALGHAVEAYTAIHYSAKSRPETPADRPDYNGRSPLTDQFARKAIDLIGDNLRRAVYNGQDLEAREAMALASLMAGMAFTNAGTTAAHAMAMATGAKYKIPHGVAVAVFLPEVIRFNTPSAPERFREVAELLGENPTEVSAAKAVDKLAADIGIPNGISEFGVTEEMIPELAEQALKLERLMNQNARRATQDDLEQLFKNTL